MIGYYNYTVILTYFSLMSSMAGMMFTVNGRFKSAVFCLALSGLCDMFDGKIARRKKDRTEDEKKFGIQIDSLCDVVCFGAFPALLCYRLGMDGIPGIAILLFYCTAGVIRLGDFNVMEEKRQGETTEARKYYQGLPITSMAIALPITFALAPLFRKEFVLVLHLLVFAVGLLFIVDFKLKKPKNATLAVLVGIVALALAKVLHWF